MEFIELIKTPKHDNVVLWDSLGNKIEGTLCITSHHMIISSRDDQSKELFVLHSMVDVVDKRINPIPNGGTLVLKCKNFRILNLEILGIVEFYNIASSIEWLSSLNDSRLLYPFFYNPEFNIVQDGWTAFKIENEFANLINFTDDWRISTVNLKFEVCRTYPELVIVPKAISDESLIAISRFRCLGRFPVLSYAHKCTKAVLLRSGQPMVGNNTKRCKEDEKLINTVLGAGKRGYIVETRPTNQTQVARSKGGGVEPEMHYPLWKRVHKPIEAQAALLNSLSKLVEACNDPNLLMDKWLTKLESCGWLAHVKDVLGNACLVAQFLDQEACSVLVHGSEGMDSTLQVCSITQVMLNPDCRTVHGFEALIEREWLQAGHPFATRCKHSAYMIPSLRTREQSPVFLVFLDCVYQIYCQFQCSFEFNENFLIALFDNAYASRFGTFLGDCAKEREDMNIDKKTVSLWSYINRPDKLQEYLNPLYEPNNAVLWPSVAPQSMQIWRGLYFRWTQDFKPMQGAMQKIAELMQQETNLKLKASQLRRTLDNLLQHEKEAMD